MILRVETSYIFTPFYQIYHLLTIYIWVNYNCDYNIFIYINYT